jgi:hypothetical protein
MAAMALKVNADSDLQFICTDTEAVVWVHKGKWHVVGDKNWNCVTWAVLCILVRLVLPAIFSVVWWGDTVLELVRAELVCTLGIPFDAKALSVFGYQLVAKNDRVAVPDVAWSFELVRDTARILGVGDKFEEEDGEISFVCGVAGELGERAWDCCFDEGIGVDTIEGEDGKTDAAGELGLYWELY